MNRRRCGAPPTMPLFYLATEREIIICRDVDELNQRAAEQFTLRMISNFGISEILLERWSIGSL
jgi:hypothetical protein